jgi:FixJ family two-component response regulator
MVSVKNLCKEGNHMSLTKKEREVLDKLLVADVKTAAGELGVKPATIYVVRSRVRAKIEQARDLLNEIKKYKRAIGHSQEEF